MNTEFKSMYAEYMNEATTEAIHFIEKSMGLYTKEDLPAFIAGYLQACLRRTQDS